MPTFYMAIKEISRTNPNPK